MTYIEFKNEIKEFLYANVKDYDKDYIMWQLCNNGLVDGINGDVDINVYYK